MAEIFRRLDEVILSSITLMTFMTLWLPSRIGATRARELFLHSTVQCNVGKPSTTLNAPVGCQSSTSPLVRSFVWDN